jgi:hypothetical protein
MDNNGSISITDMNKNKYESFNNNSNVINDRKVSQEYIQASRSNYYRGNNYNQNNSNLVTCTPGHVLLFDKLKNYAPRYLCNIRRPENTCTPSFKYCSQPKKPICVKPPIKAAKIPCPPVAKPRCGPVFEKKCELPEEICIENRKVCPTFEALLTDQSTRFVLLSSHIKMGDLYRSEATIQSLEENTDKWGNLLGPGFVPILETHIGALVNIAGARLGNNETSIGSEEERKDLLRDSIDILHSNRRALILYFQSMKEICGNEKMICCIKKLWDRHIDLIIGMFEGLEEEKGDPEAYDDASVSLLRDSSEFGNFLDGLCLKPKAPCPGDDDTFVYRSSIKLSNLGGKNKSQQPKQSQQNQQFKQNQQLQQPQQKQQLQKTQQRQQFQQNQQGKQFQQTQQRQQGQQGQQRQQFEENPEFSTNQRTVINANNNNLTSQPVLSISSKLDSMKLKASQFGDKDNVTTDYSTISLFEDIDSIIRSAEILDVRVKLETGTIKDPTDVTTKDVLFIDDVKIIIGKYDTNGSTGDVIIFAQEPTDDTYIPFNIAGSGNLHIYLDFKLVWENNGPKDKTMVTGSQKGTYKCRFMGGNFSLHGLINLIGTEINGLYTSPRFTQNGIDYFVQIKLNKAPVCSKNGSIDQYYGISYFSIVIPGK